MHKYMMTIRAIAKVTQFIGTKLLIKATAKVIARIDLETHFMELIQCY